MNDITKKLTMVALYQVNDIPLVRACRGLSEGDVGITGEFLTIDDLQSDEPLLNAYDWGVRRFVELGLGDSADGWDREFVDALQTLVGTKFSVRQIERMYVGSIRHDLDGTNVRVVGVRRDAAGRQSEQSRELIDVNDRGALAAAIRRCFSYM